MELGTFTPRANTEGDSLPSKDCADNQRPLVVLVREHRTGIKTRYNSTPGERGYKPDGGDGVTVDVADVRTDEVFIDVLWMNGAVVDNLADYVGQPVAVKLVWTASQKGGSSYISVNALEGDELALAQQWVARNPQRFDTERAERTSRPAETPPPAAASAQPAAAQPVTAAPAATPASTQPTPAAVDPNDPAVQALLAQLAQQQQAS
jgi:hypothetical protein